MVNLNKHTQKKQNLNLNQHANSRTVQTSVRIIVQHAQLSYTTQHSTVMIIFTPNLQTAQMLSIGGQVESSW